MAKRKKKPQPREIVMIGDLIAVVADEAESQTESGLHLVQRVEDAPVSGVVAASGPGQRSALGELIPMTVEVGDRVMFLPHTGHDLGVDADQYLVMSEQEILAIVR